MKLKAIHLDAKKKQQIIWWYEKIFVTLQLIIFNQFLI